jgi:hypothetical protein
MAECVASGKLRDPEVVCIAKDTRMIKSRFVNDGMNDLFKTERL